ncbi:LTA synthase family protein [Helicobacter sp. 13S00477-4]|uniref:LTA synthase family protein n=1 Tax=Helicobacter sp. 13S00477-4 TaxID=1905759 RepID=UPI000BA65BCA|nr:LTA synthase family protein [Helicobacter sp. 13S00477-4]PAF52861.1 hypothetical protein BKH44_01380 [Helicobacter sp. 13S00477-4]
MYKPKILNTLSQSIVFVLFLSCLFICIRVAFILYVGIAENRLGGEFDSQDIFYSLYNGFLYDNRTAAFFSLLYFLLSLVLIFTRFQNKILFYYASLVIVICIFLGIANMEFYVIYGDTFDRRLFGLISDDQKAIFKTGMSGTYNLSFKLISFILSSFIMIYLYRKYSNLIEKIIFKKSFISKISILVTFFLFVGLCLFFINSQFGLKSANLLNIKNSKNVFLRRVTLGAFRDIYLIYKNYQKVAHSKFSNYSDQTPVQVAKDFFNLDKTVEPPFNLYELLSQVSSNTSKVKIEHIFYIVSESLSEWAFDPEFDTIGLTSGLKSFIDNQHGFKIQNFLENAPRTIESLEVQITGLYNTDMLMNPMLGSMPLFPTAIGGILKRLDYDTRFYYGGSAFWQKIDKHATTEGFNEILYNTFILDYAKDKNYLPPLENMWGVYDNVLFDYIIDNTSKANHPTFNMIMTTSNHPPYDVSLNSFDVPLKEIRAFIDEHFPKNKRFLEANENILGHIWWYDKQITHFIREAARRFPKSLFIITGDHFDNMYPLANRNNRIVKSIPLIVYSPILQPKQLSNVGSHIDIASTIVELVSPKGFRYSSFGKPLFSNNHSLKFENKRYALGFYVVGTHRFIYTVDGGLQYINDSKPQSDDKQEAEKLYNRLQEAKALSWWILMKGNEIE